MPKEYKNKPKRIYLENQIYFVTSKTFDNKPIFNNQNKAQIFLSAFQFLEARKDFESFAVVLLPDHFHLLLKPVNKNISEVIHNLKSYSAQRINQYRRGILASPSNQGEDGSLTYKGGDNFLPVWQRSFYYHLVLSDKDFENHFYYIIYNPVKHNYVAKHQQWPWLYYDYI